MLTVTDVHTYYGDSHVLQGVTMTAAEGKVTAVLGRNGVGKTTLAYKLPADKWFHYSGDYRIGTKYLAEPILDNIKRQAMKVDFLRDVNPVLSQLGCSSGPCHGAKDGKAGFKLSLRGYDPIFDVRSLVDDHAGRRVNLASPDDSLMLLKATGAVPHEGGQRTAYDDKYYRILRAWIAGGARLDLSTPRVTSIELEPRDPVLQRVGVVVQVTSRPLVMASAPLPLP